jgi:hypothetical protein
MPDKAKRNFTSFTVFLGNGKADEKFRSAWAKRREMSYLDSVSMRGGNAIKKLDISGKSLRKLTM